MMEDFSGGPMGTGSILGKRDKILHATGYSQKIGKKEKNVWKSYFHVIFTILTAELLLLLLSCISRVRLCATPQTAAHQAPLSLRFSRQESWSRLSFPSPVQSNQEDTWGHWAFNCGWPKWRCSVSEKYTLDSKT